MFGSFAAIMPAFFNIEVLSELVNIGTLLAFTIVWPACGYCGCAIPHMERPFKTPFVPLVPILGILSAVYLMTRLVLITWEVMIGWLLIGLVIYFGYSREAQQGATTARTTGCARRLIAIFRKQQRPPSREAVRFRSNFAAR